MRNLFGAVTAISSNDTSLRGGAANAKEQRLKNWLLSQGLQPLGAEQPNPFRQAIESTPGQQIDSLPGLVNPQRLLRTRGQTGDRNVSHLSNLGYLSDVPATQLHHSPTTASNMSIHNAVPSQQNTNSLATPQLKSPSGIQRRSSRRTRAATLEYTDLSQSHPETQQALRPPPRIGSDVITPRTPRKGNRRSTRQNSQVRTSPQTQTAYTQDEAYDQITVAGLDGAVYTTGSLNE